MRLQTDPDILKHAFIPREDLDQVYQVPPRSYAEHARRAVDPNATEASRRVAVYHLFSRDAERALGFLSSLAARQSGDASEAALYALGYSFDRRVCPALERVMRGSKGSAPEANTARFKAAAALAAGFLGAEGTDLFPVLCTVLDCERELPVREAAAWALGQILPQSTITRAERQAATDLLLAIVDEAASRIARNEPQYPDLAVIAIEALGTSREPGVLPTLAGLVWSQANTRLGEAASTSLGRAGADAVPYVISLLLADDELAASFRNQLSRASFNQRADWIAKRASLALGAIGMPAAAALSETVDHPSPKIREQIWDAFAEIIEPKVRSMAATEAERIKETELFRAECAARAHELRHLIGPVRRDLNSDNDDLISAAIEVAAALGTEARDLLPEVVGVIERKQKKGTHTAALNTLPDLLGGDPLTLEEARRALPAVLAYATRRGLDSDTRMSAVRQLNRLFKALPAEAKVLDEFAPVRAELGIS